MADDGSVQGATWPLPKFRFEVDLGAGLGTIAFQEVSGLDAENQVIEYRNTNSALFSTTKMPGIKKYGNLTMKRGIFSNDDIFWKWYQEIKMNTIKKTTVLIKLLDDEGAVNMQWNLINALPVKVSSTDLKSNGSDVAVETLEIVYEQLIIATK